MPQLARVFQSGNSQAVRLPREFRFEVERVEVTREGEALILRPHVEPKTAWSSLRAAVQRGVSEDFMAEGRDQPGESDNPALDALFR